MKLPISVHLSLGQSILLFLFFSPIVALGERAQMTNKAISLADFLSSQPDNVADVGISMHWIGPCAIPPGESITATFCTDLHEGVMCPTWAQQQLMCLEARTNPDFMKRLLQEKPSCKKGEEANSVYRCVGRGADGKAALGKCVFSTDSPTQLGCTLYYVYDKDKVPKRVCVNAKVGCGSTCEVMGSPEPSQKISR